MALLGADGPSGATGDRRGRDYRVRACSLIRSRRCWTSPTSRRPSTPARASVDAALRHRALRRRGGPVAAEVGLRVRGGQRRAGGARRHDVTDVRAGSVTDPVLQGALRVAEALPGLADRWPTAPRQVLARLHLLAARGVVADDSLGRPVGDPRVAARLDALAELVVGQAPRRRRWSGPRWCTVSCWRCGLSPGPYGVVARAGGAADADVRRLRPAGLVAVEVGHLEREPEYVGAAGRLRDRHPGRGALLAAPLRHRGRVAARGGRSRAAMHGRRLRLRRRHRTVHRVTKRAPLLVVVDPSGIAATRLTWLLRAWVPGGRGRSPPSPTRSATSLYAPAGTPRHLSERGWAGCPR